MESFGEGWLRPIPEPGNSEVPHTVEGTERPSHLDEEETRALTLRPL